MQPRFLVTSYAIVTAIVIAVVLYGSFYPFHFAAPAGGPGPVASLLESWRLRPSGRGDILANVVLYVPLGFFAVLAIGRHVAPATRLIAACLLGGALCLTVELGQYYDPGRSNTLWDVATNATGTAIGAALGIMLGGGLDWPLARKINAQPFPALLIGAWLGYRLFPYVPVIDLHKYWDALKPIVLTPSLAAADLLRYTIVWLFVAALLTAVFGRRRVWLQLPVFAAFVFFAKILILEKVLNLSEIVASILAWVIWLTPVLRRPRTQSVALAVVFGALVIALRLEPYRFGSSAGQFGWIPFLSMMSGSIEADVQSFFEKFFLYGGLIWLLVTSGMRLATATVSVTAIALATSVAQVWLPGRSAEITDAAMALLAGGVMALFGQAQIKTEADDRRAREAALIEAARRRLGR